MGTPGFTIRSERTYVFPVRRTALWKLLGQTDDYRTWWPWIRSMSADGGLVVGAAWHCTIQPPLPYALHGTIHLRKVEEPELLVAHLTGDLVGEATMSLEPTADDAESTEVHLTTDLAAASGPIRLMSRALPSLARWGHDWVLDTAAKQFQTTALSE